MVKIEFSAPTIRELAIKVAEFFSDDDILAQARARFRKFGLVVNVIDPDAIEDAPALAVVATPLVEVAA